MGTTPHQEGPQQRRRFDTLLQTCRDKVLVHTGAQLCELFDNADPALLDFAAKAESNEMQGRLFDAMGEVRNKRSLVEQAFRKRIASAFDHFGQPDSPSLSSAASIGVSLEEMSLVALDEVEESLAIDSIISKARDAYCESLYALSQRLAVINGGRKVKERSIPAGPHHLAGAFQSAARDLEVDTKIKLILFALFEKYVLKRAKSIYDEFNDDLIAAGILPHLKPVLHRCAQDGETEATTALNAAGTKPHEDAYTRESAQDLGDELLSSILSLMVVKRDQHGAAYTAAPANPVPAATVVSAIERVKPTLSTYTSGASGQTGTLLPPDVDLAFRDNISDALAQERQRVFTELDREHMNVADADTIDLVGMLFKYMLDDTILPNVAKTLISHLHTSYLKVAIIDRRLLTDSRHPARSLLDELIEAGSEWVYEHDLNRGIFPDMKTTVDRVLKEFTDNVDMFDEFLAEFLVAVERQKRKTNAIEQRSQEAAKEWEKLHLARQRAVKEMKARANQTCVPQIAADFLMHVWTDKLIFILLRHPAGDGSADWTEALRIADDIVRVFEPKTSAGERRALVKVLGLMRESIEAGLESLGGAAPDQCAPLFELLENSGLPPPDKKISAQHADNQPLPRPRPGQERQSTLETAATESAPRERPEEELTPAEQAVLKRLRTVKFGTWFEFRDRDSGNPLRLKLSWFSPVTSTYMFVDSAGEQAAMKTLPSLVKEITGGHANLFEESKQPFVERTLQSIRNMLQRGTAQAS